jgi:SAM-dependent methyltransferase
MSDHTSNPLLPPTPGEEYSQARQVTAYNQLVSVYEERHELLQPVRHTVLDWALAGLPSGSTALEVGCGCGASLSLIAQRGFRAEGIDFSPDMVAAARQHSGCRVSCGDFLAHTFAEQYDLVFAQAFIHLFPKREVIGVLRKVQSLARRRVFFSTTINDVSSEGWEEKDGAVRYRSRYTRTELHHLITTVAGTEWTPDFLELPDPLEKLWLDVIITRI